MSDPNPVPPPPGVAPAQYQYPYPARQGLSTGAKVGIGIGAGCLVLVVIPFVIVVVLFLITLGVGSQFGDTSPSSPVDDSNSGTGTIDDSASDSASLEAQWKSGDDWLPAPAETESQPGDFLPGYATPEDWLATTGDIPAGFDVVFTSDPDYNCGLSKASASPDWVVGCYNPDYGQTLFLWWGPDAADDMKELILLHEYSHFFQNWNEYDATHSAGLDGLYDDPDFVQEVWETDATCRVYYDWGYTSLQYLDSYTVSPCGTTDWDDDWLAEQLEDRGVTIEDW